MVCFEDDADELDRRVAAAMMHHRVTDDEIGDRLHLAAPGLAAGKLMVIDPDTKQPVLSDLAPTLEAMIVERKIDLVILDPLKKIHGVEENNNDHMDAVVQVLTDMASRLNVAIDLPHHMAKGRRTRQRQSRSRRFGAEGRIRLGYTMTHMSVEEAKALSIPEDERRRYVRVDAAKVEHRPLCAARSGSAVGEDMATGRGHYPDGDVHADGAVVAAGPDGRHGWRRLHRILMEIRDGPMAASATATRRAAGAAACHCVRDARARQSAADARAIVKQWIEDGVVRVGDYYSATKRKHLQGLFVSTALTPGGDEA